MAAGELTIHQVNHLRWKNPAPHFLWPYPISVYLVNIERRTWSHIIAITGKLRNVVKVIRGKSISMKAPFSNLTFWKSRRSKALNRSMEPYRRRQRNECNGFIINHVPRNKESWKITISLSGKCDVFPWMRFRHCHKRINSRICSFYKRDSWCSSRYWKSTSSTCITRG